jgi:protein gp37
MTYEGLTRVNKAGLPQWTGKITTVEEALDEPLRWKRPRVVFVNSMSDLFHENIPVEFVRRVFATMQEAHWHSFQVLTKRPERALALAKSLPWSSNVWLGASVESATYLHRIDTLRAIPAEIRFLSIEPLLGPLPPLNLSKIHWVIVGGESGPGARPMERAWVRQIRDNCVRSDVPFFFKQWGGVRKKLTGRVLDGRTWNEMPTSQVAAE